MSYHTSIAGHDNSAATNTILISRKGKYCVRSRGCHMQTMPHSECLSDGKGVRLESYYIHMAPVLRLGTQICPLLPILSIISLFQESSTNWTCHRSVLNISMSNLAYFISFWVSDLGRDSVTPVAESLPRSDTQNDFICTVLLNIKLVLH